MTESLAKILVFSKKAIPMCKLKFQKVTKTRFLVSKPMPQSNIKWHPQIMMQYIVKVNHV